MMDKLRSSFLLHFASWPQDMNCSALPYEDRLKAMSQHEQFIHFKQFCLLFGPSDNKIFYNGTEGQREGSAEGLYRAQFPQGLEL